MKGVFLDAGLTAYGFFLARTAVVDDDRAILGLPRLGLRVDLADALRPPDGPSPNDDAARRRQSGLALADVAPRLGELRVPGLAVLAAAPHAPRACDACRDRPATFAAPRPETALCLPCAAHRLGGHVEPPPAF